MSRQDELAAALEAVRDRIAIATAEAGRKRGPALIVVTKFFPVSDVAALATLGIRDVGENRDQEASAKASAAAEAPQCTGLHWHFIGQLQSNKAKSVVQYASAVHSVDRPSVIRALSKAMVHEQDARHAAGSEPRSMLQCLIQVNLDETVDAAGVDSKGERMTSRGGAGPADVFDLADGIEAAPQLELTGLMAVAPLDGDADAAFRRLAEISAALQERYSHARAISAGMSSDLEQAIRHGATHLRVGSDILGERPGLR